MLRPGLGLVSLQGTAQSSSPGPSRTLVSNPSQSGPPFAMHGRGGSPGPFPEHLQHFSGQYPGYPGPQRGAGPPPSHHAGDAPTDRMPSSTPIVAEWRAVEEPPLAPQDSDMLKNIDILSGFVVKNGPQFEDMARHKQADDPKFAFLFGGVPGSEAAIGKAYYEWKKRSLIAAANLPADPFVQPRSNNEPEVFPPSPLPDTPHSPHGSDMDMEDDFEKPSQSTEIRCEQVQEPVSSLPAKKEPVLSSKMETNAKPQGAQNPRVPIPLTVTYQSSSTTASVAPPQVSSSVGVSSRPQSNSARDDLPKRKDTRRRTGFDRSCMEDVTPVSSPPVQAKSQELEAAGQGHGSRSSSRVSRWGPQDRSLGSGVEDRLEAVTPPRDNDSEHKREGDKNSQLEDASTKSEDRKTTEYSTMPDRDQPKDSSLRLENRKMRVSDDRKSRDSTTLEESRIQDEPPRASKQQKGVSELDPGNKGPTVDEFGRFIRPGGSESDAEDSHYDRKRRHASRSRSRSPPDNRRRRRSRSSSPRRHSRRSHSRSRSPRRRRSWSKSPGRETRRGGDSARGRERGNQDRNDRGGRRGGRGDRGGGPPVCLDFARGRCKRGNVCRFAHTESTNDPSTEGRYDRGGGRGGRGSRLDDRQESHDSGRSHGGGSSRSGWNEQNPRGRRGWEPTDQKEKCYNKELRKSMEDFAREQPETSPVSDYGDEAKLSERRNNERSKDRSYQDANATNSVESGSFAVETHAPFSGGPDGLPSLAQLPPPPPLPHHSQGFSSSSVPPQQSYMGYLPSQSGFNLPPPPPPPLMNQSENLSMPQPSYGNSGAPQPALPPQVSSGIANLPMRPAVSTGPSQVGGQSMAPTSRSSYTWQSTPTAAPASIAYNGQSIQASGAQSNYGLPPPPPPPSAAYTSTLSRYQLPQQSQAAQPGGQFNVMAMDRPELGPPGARDAGVKGGQDNTAVVSRPNMGQWKSSGGNGTSTHMDDVVLESVSPGLPGHHRMENLSPGPGPGLVMESVSPALVAYASNTSTVPTQGTGASTFGSSQQDNPNVAGLESVSPAPEEPQNWSPGGGGDTNKDDKRGDKRDRRDKDHKSDKDHKVKGMTFLRTAVAEHVKETLKPTWREGQMSKEAFKTIAKKAVDKVLSAIKPHQVPTTEEKVEAYMMIARPKISKLVQGYVDKYVKT
ncbi:uncharacterized protein [Physcomitrium patens]|uniref:uncharacterized protein isoform X2 n=1 Tax=Physcomitrium patens TaxID=3218 RepID=UPI000D161A66|nr:zinc finger CCCH domain-containing protein 55-like isoform X2 [Physcomitrium patens]|eukprot:XP_024373661.1 zinc finger CCCH domain-containing protein 55-like isoform X2 [Physcomitrella patens]